ncbi:pseudouridine synthase [Treponema vincentii]|uniref:16S rRNA pseudouridine(516) synthase n=1 Tax=Treponema TaxID=157 RepID=UPI001BB08BA2|nr:pseudouridine synthase [Treponema vincentii]QUY18700.1 pseudouridine synthase [Treponema vincentii]
MLVRIDKILAANGLGSRKDIRRLLRKEDFRINGIRVTDAGTLLDPEHDMLLRNGEKLYLRTCCYLMLNKPAGVVTSTADPLHCTVMELLPSPFSAMKLFPIGRLDIDTEGLLIITDDGELTHRLTAPKSACIKSYYLETAAPFTEAEFNVAQTACSQGLALGKSFTCLPATFERTEAHNIKTEWAFLMHICEGKYHQVKKMIKALGNEVVYLKRISMGGVTLDRQLAAGSCRELTPDEVATLKKI